MRFRNRLKPVLGFCSILLAAQSYSQEPKCGFDRVHRGLLLQNESFQKTVSQQQENVRQYLQRSSRTTGTVYTIPVVVHVIHLGEAVGTGTNISDAQIQSAITSMSQRYRGTLGSSVDTEIQFELATLSPNCTATSGIVRVDGRTVAGYSTSGLTTGASGNETAVKNLSRWNSGNYYNIWIVSEINNNNAGFGTQGFAYFPGAPASLDGAVMLYNAFGYDPTATLGYNLKAYTNRNATATHEMGHALGLYHTFEGDDSNPTDATDVSDVCPPNTSCSNDGDMVCDTDPHMRTPSTCPSPATANGCNGGAPFGTIINNYMDYSSETCQNRFTTGQSERMRAFLELFRPGLTSSLGSNTASYPYGTYAAPVAASCSPATGATGLSDAYAGIMNVSVNNHHFTSSYAASTGDNGYVNGTTSCVNTTSLIAGTNYTFRASVLGVNFEQVRAWIDYNNNGIFENATESIFANTNITPDAAMYPVVSGTFTVPASAVKNTSLRMRITNDLGSSHGVAAIPNACYAPTYGQVEDYIVRISGVLPVNLTAFNGKWKGEDVELDWKTSAEQGSRNFEVQRSEDGVNFRTIGSVQSAVNSTETRNYAFTDHQPGATNYYRLKMNDADGDSRFSNVVLVRNEEMSQKMWLLSNPANEKLEIRFARKPGQLKLQLLNTAGAVVAEEQRSNSSEMVQWNLPAQLSKGVYILKANAGDQEFTQKVLIR